MTCNHRRVHAAMLPPCSSLPWGHFIAQIMKLNTLRSIKRLMISSSGQLYQYILILPSHKILQSSLTTNWMLRQVSVSEISFSIILFDPFVWFYHVIIQIFRLFDIYSHSVLRSSVFLKNDLLLVVQCSSCWLAPGQWSLSWGSVQSWLTAVAIQRLIFGSWLIQILKCPTKS